MLCAWIPTNYMYDKGELRTTHWTTSLVSNRKMENNTICSEDKLANNATIERRET